MPKLIVLTEGIEPTSFEFTKEATSVGRDDENDITLPHQSVSGSHAELVMRGEDVHVRDLGSTNGTYIGTVRITQPTTITMGTQVRIGKTILELRK